MEQTVAEKSIVRTFEAFDSVTQVSNCIDPELTIVPVFVINDGSDSRNSKRLYVQLNHQDFCETI